MLWEMLLQRQCRQILFPRKPNPEQEPAHCTLHDQQKLDLPSSATKEMQAVSEHANPGPCSRLEEILVLFEEMPLLVDLVSHPLFAK